MTTKKLSYSESVSELEQILNKLEKNDVPLEELTPLIKRASELIQLCKSKLHEMDGEIQQLLDDIQV
jgi:exodeoxyribonuclease VII small subunit